jgi:hypothetical protein
LYHCMHTGVIASEDEHSKMGKRRALPSGLPWAAAVQYSSICRQSAEWWRKRRRRIRMALGERATVVMASGMHAWGGSCVVPGGRGIARVVVKGLTAA